jgi:AraC family transcriptional regulator of adaptative response/methylated-DNA-[protein]-cysteine methyltransferase
MGAALDRIRQGDEVTKAAFAQGYESLSGFQEAFGKLLGAPPKQASDGPVLAIDRTPTPLGPMLVGATDDGLYLLEFVDRRRLETQLRRVRDRLGGVLVPGTNVVVRETVQELSAYFAGRLRAFSVPLRPEGTPFQCRVWDALRSIPYGETRSYGEVAEAIGRPTASRAVARANGDNRIAVLIPCHRVIGADGTLTGYGGGLWRKRRLLELESGQTALLPRD